MEGETRHFYEFGPFRVDAKKRQLLRDGKPQQLTPKAFDILIVLLRHAGQLIEKDELMRAVWPGIVVEENNLTRNISALRKALGEGPHDHNYVVTVPGRGYSFVAGVRDVADDRANVLMAGYRRTHVVVEEEEDDSAVAYEFSGARVQQERVTGRNIEKLSGALTLAAERHWQVSPFALKVMVVTALAALTFGLAYVWISGKSGNANRIPSPVGSIAVLPFQTLNAGGEDDEYLGLGMTDALITKLGNLRSVVVRPTSAVRKYSSGARDPLTAGREQGVEAVLDGSVQKTADRIRVTVRLVKVQDGASLWAGKFDERFTDFFTVQDSISEQVARALVPHLTGEEQQQLTKRHTTDTEAYQLYLKGRYFWNKRSEDGYQKAIELFQQAIQRDPTYAQAYAGLTDAYALLGPMRTDGLARREVMLRAKAAALKALELDDTLAEAHTSLAFVLMHYDWDWTGAEKEFRRAIELNPNYATAHHWYAYNLIAMGRMDEAVSEIKRAQAIDPLSLIINTDVGEILYYARRYDEAIEQSQKTLEMDSNFVLAHRVLAWAYQQKGLHREAITELQHAVDISGGGPGELAWLGHAYGVAGERDKALAVLNKVRELSKRRYVGSISMAKIYLGLGEKDPAFAWLEKVYEERDGVLILLKVWPLLDPLRSDPRFADLLQRVGLEA